MLTFVSHALLTGLAVFVSVAVLAALLGLGAYLIRPGR